MTDKEPWRKAKEEALRQINKKGWPGPDDPVKVVPGTPVREAAAKLKGMRPSADEILAGFKEKEEELADALGLSTPAVFTVGDIDDITLGAFADIEKAKKWVEKNAPGDVRIFGWTVDQEGTPNSKELFVWDHDEKTWAI